MTGMMPDPNQWNLQRKSTGPNRRPTAREAIAELTWRYHFWRTACITTWVLAAVGALLWAK